MSRGGPGRAPKGEMLARGSRRGRELVQTTASQTVQELASRNREFPQYGEYGFAVKAPPGVVNSGERQHASRRRSSRRKKPRLAALCRKTASDAALPRHGSLLNQLSPPHPFIPRRLWLPLGKGLLKSATGCPAPPFLMPHPPMPEKELEPVVMHRNDFRAFALPPEL